jgi:hypothetical protein
VTTFWHKAHGLQTVLCVAASAGLAAPAGAETPAPTVEACPPAQTSGGNASSPTPAATTPPRPGQILACVATQSIIGSVYLHWAHVAELAALGPGEPAGQPAPLARAIVEEAMGFLISSYWVIGEAHDLKIHVSGLEVRRRFDHVRREQFPRLSEFKKFLKASGQTVADLLFRVRLNILSSAIQRHVSSHPRGGGRLGRFLREFRAKWLARTYCLPAYAISDCGHVQLPV